MTTCNQYGHSSQLVVMSTPIFNPLSEVKTVRAGIDGDVLFVPIRVVCTCALSVIYNHLAVQQCLSRVACNWGMFCQLGLKSSARGLKSELLWNIWNLKQTDSLHAYVRVLVYVTIINHESLMPLILVACLQRNVTRRFRAQSRERERERER